MTQGEFFKKICNILKEMFFKSYGDSTNSKSVTTTLPASSDWQAVMLISTSSILYFRNKDAANEVEFTFNETDVVGAQIKEDTAVVLDNVSGTLFARVVDNTTTATINISVVALRTSDV